MSLWDKSVRKEMNSINEKNLTIIGDTDSFGVSGEKESIIASGLTIDGNIKGSGMVRVSGRFNGDVRVDGTLTIESGAYISGEVQADQVLVKGEVNGNILANTHVALSESGVIIGDVKAPSLSVTAGSRMRGKVEFGWKNEELEIVIPIQHTASDR